MSSRAALLDAAAAALAETRRVAALSLLIEAWREGVNPDIATVARALSEEIGRALPELDESLEPPDYQQAWMDLAVAQREIDVPRLAAGLFRAPLGRSLAARVDHLASRPLDPRVTEAFASMIAAPPATSQSLFPMWNAMFALLERAGDTSVRPYLRARLDEPEGTSRFWPRHYLKTRELLAALDAAAQGDAGALSERERARIDAIIGAVANLSARAPLLAEQLLDEQADEGARGGSAAATAAALGAPDADELLAAVRADPADLSLRAVYADLLAERGDPRGELISLMLRDDLGEASVAEQRRIRALLKPHAARWAGDLQPLLVPKQFGFRNGFLDWCEVIFSSERQRALIGSPAWATVSTLYSHDVELITSGAMRALRAVGGFGLATLEALLRHDAPLAVEHLGPIALSELPADLSALPRESVALPALRSVALTYASHTGGGAASWDWLCELPLLDQLARVEVLGAPWRHVDWVDLQRRLGVETLSLLAHPEALLTLRRAPDGYHLTVAQLVDFADYAVENVRLVADEYSGYLQSLCARPPLSLRVEHHGARPAPAGLYEQLFAALRERAELAGLRGVDVTVVADPKALGPQPARGLYCKEPTLPYIESIALARARGYRQQRAAKARAGRARRAQRG